MVTVETSLGPVPVAGDFGGSGPLVFAITGAFPARDFLLDVAPAGVGLARVHLPGFHSRFLSELSVEAFGRSFDEVIASIAPERDVTAVGASAGALAALSLKSAQVRAIVLVEPFFSTAPPALVSWLRRDYPDTPANAAAWRWLGAVLGITPTEAPGRDYRGLLDNPRPVTALCGTLPDARPLPSLTSGADRRLLAARGAKIVDIASGHAVPTAAIREAVTEVLSVRA